MEETGKVKHSNKHNNKMSYRTIIKFSNPLIL